MATAKKSVKQQIEVATKKPANKVNQVSFAPSAKAIFDNAVKTGLKDARAAAKLNKVQKIMVKALSPVKPPMQLRALTVELLRHDLSQFAPTSTLAIINGKVAVRNRVGRIVAEIELTGL